MTTNKKKSGKIRILASKELSTIRTHQDCVAKQFFMPEVSHLHQQTLVQELLFFFQTKKTANIVDMGVS